MPVKRDWLMIITRGSIKAGAICFSNFMDRPSGPQLFFGKALSMIFLTAFSLVGTKSKLKGIGVVKNVLKGALPVTSRLLASLGPIDEKNRLKRSDICCFVSHGELSIPCAAI